MLMHLTSVELVDFHWDDKNIYIVMEYCDGGDLSAVIRQRKQLPEPACRRFLQQLGAALQFLRKHNVSHLDLKPSNLLICGSHPPLLKVADFGFAQHLSEDGVERGLRGSPLYMAPEIFLQDEYTAKADLWSAGVILHEALFGRAPWSSESLEQLVAKIKEDKPVTISSARHISQDLRELLSRLLVRCPEKRISFSDFFSHPVLDLAHLPGPDTLATGTQLAAAAVQADRAGRLEEAVSLYQSACCHLSPLLHYQPSSVPASLAGAVAGYQRRSQQLSRQQPGDPGPAQTPVSQLLLLVRPGDKIQTGLEICQAGEDYASQGSLQLALDKLTAGLGLLVPALQFEPRGTARRPLLSTVVTQYMQRAEGVKQELGEGAVEAAGSGTGQQSCVLQ